MVKTERNLRTGMIPNLVKMIKPRISILSSRYNDVYAKIRIPDGCPFTCVNILKEALTELGLKEAQTEEKALHSHRYEDWKGKSQIHRGDECVAHTIYNSELIHLIATTQTKDQKEKILKTLGKHFILEA